MSVSAQERFERMDLELMRGRPFSGRCSTIARLSPGSRVANFFQRR